VATHARFNVPDHEDVIGLLTRLVREPRSGSLPQEGQAKKLFLT
jgi:hypothetical protein